MFLDENKRRSRSLPSYSLTQVEVTKHFLTSSHRLFLQFENVVSTDRNRSEQFLRMLLVLENVTWEIMQSLLHWERVFNLALKQKKKQTLWNEREILMVSLEEYNEKSDSGYVWRLTFWLPPYWVVSAFFFPYMVQLKLARFLCAITFGTYFISSIRCLNILNIGYRKFGIYRTSEICIKKLGEANQKANVSPLSPKYYSILQKFL